MRRLLFPVLVWFLCVPAVAAEAPVVLIVGDSLSAAYGMAVNDGWVALLRERIDAEGLPHEVVNASVSGDTSSGGLARLPDLLERHDPALVVIELGGNDGLRGLPLERLRVNLAQMVRLARARGARTLLVGMRMPPNYGPLYTERFEAVYRDVARETGAALVPFLLAGVAGDDALMQTDRMHAAAAAQPQLLANVWPALQPLLQPEPAMH